MMGTNAAITPTATIAAAIIWYLSEASRKDIGPGLAVLFLPSNATGGNSVVTVVVLTPDVVSKFLALKCPCFCSVFVDVDAGADSAVPIFWNIFEKVVSTRPLLHIILQRHGMVSNMNPYLTGTVTSKKDKNWAEFGLPQKKEITPEHTTVQLQYLQYTRYMYVLLVAKVVRIRQRRCLDFHICIQVVYL